MVMVLVDDDPEMAPNTDRVLVVTSDLTVTVTAALTPEDVTALAKSDQLLKFVPDVLDAASIVYEPLNCALATPAKNRSISKNFPFKKLADIVKL
jgi:hypothetical protein